MKLLAFTGERKLSAIPATPFPSKAPSNKTKGEDREQWWLIVRRKRVENERGAKAGKEVVMLTWSENTKRKNGGLLVKCWQRREKDDKDE